VLTASRRRAQLEDWAERGGGAGLLPVAGYDLVRGGLYRDREAADAVLDELPTFMPFLADTVESWHHLLLPSGTMESATTLSATAPANCLKLRRRIPAGRRSS